MGFSGMARAMAMLLCHSLFDTGQTQAAFADRVITLAVASEFGFFGNKLMRRRLLIQLLNRRLIGRR